MPRTGTYAVQGEDELKGWQLAVEHINAGHELIKKISPKTKKGVLGKEVKFGRRRLAPPSRTRRCRHSSASSPRTSHADDRLDVIAVAVALNKFAQREKVLYVTGISGSNDTTGKDCVRYGFRQNFYGETAANAIGPVLVKAVRQEQEGGVHDAGLHLRSHRHQVGERLSDQEWRLDDGDQPGVAARRAGLQPYLTNIANSGADVLINVNWGRDAVLSIQQAKQFGI